MTSPLSSTNRQRPSLCDRFREIRATKCSTRTNSKVAVSVGVILRACNEIEQVETAARMQLTGVCAEKEERLESVCRPIQLRLQQLGDVHEQLSLRLHRRNEEIDHLFGTSRSLLQQCELLLNQYGQFEVGLQLLLQERRAVSEQLEQRSQVAARATIALSQTSSEISTLHRQLEEARTFLDGVGREISLERSELAILQENISGLDLPIEQLREQYREICSRLEKDQMSIQEVGHSISLLVHELVGCADEIRAIARKQAKLQRIVGAIVTVVGAAVGAYALGAFSTTAGSLSLTASTAQTASGTLFLENSLKFVAKQVVMTATSCAIDKTIGKDAPLFASALKGLGSLSAGSLVDASREGTLSTLKQICIDQSRIVTSEIAGERCGRICSILLSQKMAGESLLDVQTLETVAKQIVVSEASVLAAQQVDLRIAPLVATVVNGLGMACINSDGMELERHLQRTICSAIGEVSAMAVADPRWKQCVANSVGEVCMGLIVHSEQQQLVEEQIALLSDVCTQIDENLVIEKTSKPLGQKKAPMRRVALSHKKEKRRSLQEAEIESPKETIDHQIGLTHQVPSRRDLIHEAMAVSIREELIETMMALRLFRAVGDAISYPVDKAVEYGGHAIRWSCKSHPTIERQCRRVATWSNEAVEFVRNQIPPAWIAKAGELLADHRSGIEQQAVELENRFRIPKEMTVQFHRDFDSMITDLSFLYGAGSIVKLTKNIKLKRSLNVPLLERRCGRNECAGVFIRDLTNFEHDMKVHTTQLTSDLYLVQYHGSGRVGVDRSLKWWMPIGEANVLGTVEDVMNRFGLLSTWGERSHVSVARIPEGTKINYAVGKARSQHDHLIGEYRPGGGIQIRMREFQPEWIVDTRAIP